MIFQYRPLGEYEDIYRSINIGHINFSSPSSFGGSPAQKKLSRSNKKKRRAK